MGAYLFVHFKEKSTVDGEQVYFALSKDGLQWESVHNGQPILWSKQGDQGVRDHTIVRTKQGKFYIISTDLCLAGHFNSKYRSDWANIARYGSKQLVCWESDDLINWSEQRMLNLGDEEFGCLWAPDVIYDQEQEDYVLHWSSAHRVNDFGPKAIYYSRTKDFITFTKPELLYRKHDSGVIDSAIYRDNQAYYCFLKSEGNPHSVILLKSDAITGDYEQIETFNGEMKKLKAAEVYEAPTAYQLADGRWCLMLDFFGVRGEGQGYVPFIADHMDSGEFIRSDESFSFPYRFKHGTVLSITIEEYERIKATYPN